MIKWASRDCIYDCTWSMFLIDQRPSVRGLNVDLTSLRLTCRWLSRVNGFNCLHVGAVCYIDPVLIISWLIG